MPLFILVFINKAWESLSLFSRFESALRSTCCPSWHNKLVTLLRLLWWLQYQENKWPLWTQRFNYWLNKVSVCMRWICTVSAHSVTVTNYTRYMLMQDCSSVRLKVRLKVIFCRVKHGVDRTSIICLPPPSAVLWSSTFLHQPRACSLAFTQGSTARGELISS